MVKMLSTPRQWPRALRYPMFERARPRTELAEQKHEEVSVDSSSADYSEEMFAEGIDVGFVVEC